MAATGTPTPNIGLRIPLGTDPASVDDINYNSNALDTVIGDIGETSVAGQLSATNNRISAVQDGLAIVCNGNTHAAIEAGQFAYVKNHGTLAEGLYRNNTGSTIAANATLSSSNLTADTSGGLNTVYDALNSNFTNIDKGTYFVPLTMLVGNDGYARAFYDFTRKDVTYTVTLVSASFTGDSTEYKNAITVSPSNGRVMFYSNDASFVSAINTLNRPIGATIIVS